MSAINDAARQRVIDGTSRFAIVANDDGTFSVVDRRHDPDLAIYLTKRYSEKRALKKAVSMEIGYGVTT